MTKLLLFNLMFLCASLTAQITYQYEWSSQYENTDDIDNCKDLVTDSYGNVYWLKKNLANTVITKFDSLGNTLKTFVFGNNNNNNRILCQAIAIDTFQNIYLTGNFTGTVDFNLGTATSFLSSSGQSDIFIAKYDSAGNYIWAKRFGNTGIDIGKCIYVTNNGDLFFTGMFSGSVDFPINTLPNYIISYGEQDVFFAKYDTSGNIGYVKGFGSADNDYVNDMIVNTGGLYLSGACQGSTNFDPNNSSTIILSNGITDAYIAKYSLTGNLEWAKSFGGISTDQVESIAVDSMRNVYLFGAFAETVDFNPELGTDIHTSSGMRDIFLTKFDSAGNYVWTKTIGAANTDFPSKITVYNNRIYTTGIYMLTVDFDPSLNTQYYSSNGHFDIFFAEYDLNGNYLFNRTLGGTNIDRGDRFAFYKQNLYLSGRFQQSIDIGLNTNHVLTTNSYMASFIVKYRLLNTQADIISFSFPEQTSPGLIDTIQNAIFININSLADITNLEPSITISSGATISPGSGINQNFSLPFVYNVVSEDGYTNTDWTVFVSQLSTTTNNFLLRNITLNPNPASNFIQVNLPKELTEPVTMQLLNTLGQIVKIVHQSGDKIRIDVSNINNGLYFLKAEINGSVKTFSVVVNN